MNHLRVWFAPEDLLAGRKLQEEIDRAINLHDKLLIILSEASMSSNWVVAEINNAWKKEVEIGRRVLFPVRLVEYETIKRWTVFDADTGQDTAKEIRKYFIPDFSNWKNEESFESAFRKLMEALKVDVRSPG